MTAHIPVMLEEVLEILRPRDGAIYLDATFGGGGYADAILRAASCTLWALDRDPDAIARGAALAAQHPGRLHLLHARFGDMLDSLAARGVTALDGVVMDLGVSSFQIDQAERGFSFRQDGPLDMRMDREGASAADLVNTLPERELASILSDLGEERHARRVARAILRERAEAPITSTARLAEIVRGAVPRDPSGIDGATRSFQALRIAVNDELGEIERGLEAAQSLLAPGGRLVVVSFHSLEDRIVKRAMVGAAGRAGTASRHDPAALMPAPTPDFELLTFRALRPGAAETASNPRSRSARLRGLERRATSRQGMPT
jgi:16S rRNA (cytosine1402-N4)-methyltransferase